MSSKSADAEVLQSSTAPPDERSVKELKIRGTLRSSRCDQDIVYPQKKGNLEIPSTSSLCASFVPSFMKQVSQFLKLVTNPHEILVFQWAARRGGWK